MIGHDCSPDRWGPLRRLLPVAAVLAVALGAATPGAVAVPPVLKTPGNLTIEATSAKGAVVAYSVTADDPAATVACNPAPSSVFPLGRTNVGCTGTATSGEVSNASFTVTVVDRKPPVFSRVPSTIVTSVNGAGSAAVAFTPPTARDAVDGVVSVTCSPPPSSAFPIGETDVLCTATDRHGNAASVSFVVRVTDTVAPPDVTDVVVYGTGLSVVLTWRLPGNRDAAGAEIVRFPGAEIVYRGQGTSFADREVKGDVQYRYLVASYDRADNLSQGIAVRGSIRTTPLVKPQDGASLTAPPLLAWQGVSGADYYNVQLWQLLPSGPVKVLSIWPKTNQLQLTKSWVFGGGQHQLATGRYRWYVWPGVGPLVQANYGKLIGSSTFTIAG